MGEGLRTLWVGWTRKAEKERKGTDVGLFMKKAKAILSIVLWKQLTKNERRWVEESIYHGRQIA